MALSAIIALYICIGLVATVGSIAITRKRFSSKSEQIFYGLLLVPIACMYLAFTDYFNQADAWRHQLWAVAVFVLLGVLGGRWSILLILGYFLHGLWDFVHELRAHTGLDLGTIKWTEIPLAYGSFCAAYDWGVAVYFFSRRLEWNAAWRAKAS